MARRSLRALAGVQVSDHYCCKNCGRQFDKCECAARRARAERHARRAPEYRASIVGPFSQGRKYTVTIYDASGLTPRHVVTVYADSFADAGELARDLVAALTAEAAR